MKGLNLPKTRKVKVNASVVKRILAFVVDMMIVNIVLFGPFKKIFRELVPTENIQDVYNMAMAGGLNMNLIYITTAIAAVMAIMYFAVFEKKLGQTPGKMLTNIYVESTEKELRFWQCVARALFLLPFFPFVILWIVDPITAIINKNNQRLMEIISKTRVVEQHSL